MPQNTDTASLARAKNIFKESAAVKTAVANDEKLMANLVKMARIAAASIQNGGKILLCGNGGSAGDAQHIAAELVVRLRSDRDRKALSALTLAMDSSTLTACANDYGYDHIFERALRALARKGDVLIGITTSGQSNNVIQAMLAARDMDVLVLGFLGGTGGKAAALCDVHFTPPTTTDTGRIQEAHITAGHTLVELIEDFLNLTR